MRGLLVLLLVMASLWVGNTTEAQTEDKWTAFQRQFKEADANAYISGGFPKGNLIEAAFASAERSAAMYLGHAEITESVFQVFFLNMDWKLSCGELYHLDTGRWILKTPQGKLKSLLFSE